MNNVQCIFILKYYSNIEFYDFVDDDIQPEQEKQEPTFVEAPYIKYTLILL